MKKIRGVGDSKQDAPFTTKVNVPKVKKPVKPKPPVSKGAQRRADLVAFMRTLVGIHEIPDGSNAGPQVHMIQTATGAYNAPWCVSTGQYGWKKVLGTTWADDSANAYYVADYAQKHGCVIPKPIPGCGVVYHIGAGHYGTVITVHPDGTFDAVEGNEGNAVRMVPRDPRTLRCTFVLRPELR